MNRPELSIPWASAGLGHPILSKTGCFDESASPGQACAKLDRMAWDLRHGSLRGFPSMIHSNRGIPVLGLPRNEWIMLGKPGIDPGLRGGRRCLA